MMKKYKPFIKHIDLPHDSYETVNWGQNKIINDNNNNTKKRLNIISSTKQIERHRFIISYFVYLFIKI